MIRTPTRHTGRILAIVISIVAVLACGAVRTAAEPKRWTMVAGKSQVSFEASYPLGDFTGRTEEVSGEFLGDPGDLRQGVTGSLRVDPARLRTGIDSRDRDMWRVLAVERYPEIRFTVERVEASFPAVSDRSDVLLTISGILLVHGVERPMVFPGRVRMRAEHLWVRGENRLKMSDFGIKAPRKFLVQVSDSVLVSFDLVLAAKE